MALHKLVFDTTDANTIADSHHVGSHTLSGTGDLITSGDGASDNVANTFEALDSRAFLFGYDAVGDNWDRLQLVSGAMKVYVDGGDFAIDTAIDGVYDGVNNTNPDNVGMIAHVRGATPGDADQTFRSTGATPSSSAVDPADVYALDVNSFNMIYNGTTWDRLTGTSGSMNVNVTNTVTVNDAALANTAIVAKVNTLDVASTAEALVTTALANRKYLWVYNNDNRTLFIGGTGVTTAAGFPIPPGAIFDMRAGASVNVQWISDKLSHDARTLELS